ncbi:MAG: hypothetical protein EP329_00475 [Deltaproteobacteria bacterium]|nr:MAG: hypothetical protein EP329_00475 [Deltaproteobacteria bacterium]
MLLLAEHYPTTPFVDATPHLGDAAALHALASDLGYLYVERHVPTELVDPVRAFVREVAADYGWVRRDPNNPDHVVAVPGARLTGRGFDDPRFVELQRAVMALPEFVALVTDPRVMAVVDAAAGEPMALATTNHTWLKLPGSPEHTTLPHQDVYYIPQCPKMWTLWVPLVDTPMDVGPLGVVPRSHEGEMWPHVDPWTGIAVARDTPWSTQHVRPGATVVFDAATVHCAWSNVSPTLTRLSLDVRYEPANDPPILRAMA